MAHQHSAHPLPGHAPNVVAFSASSPELGDYRARVGIRLDRQSAERNERHNRSLRTIPNLASSRMMSG